MRLSISAKILVGFLIVLATFGGVAVYEGITMRRLGDELRLVSRGYLELRLELSELQTGQSNLLKVMEEQLTKPEGLARVPRYVKFAIDDARRGRLKGQLPHALADLAALEVLRSSPEEHNLLTQLRARFERVQSDFIADEELFDEVFGPTGDPSPQRKPEELPRVRQSGEQLMRQEQSLRRSLAHLSAELRLRAQQSGLRLEEEQNRDVWALLVLVVIAALVGVVVMLIATRMLRPLRRLADGAKKIARGDYKQRVEAAAPDEIGALGREFNAMAAALDEREQQLIRSERLAAVGKIAAQITHEVRNPLSSIGLNAEMLEEVLGAGTVLRGPQADEAQAMARAIVKEVDRLTEITEEYLRLARLPRPKLEREEVRDIVSSLLAFLRGELERRGVEVVVEMPPLPQVAADEHQLRQALLNLLRNAVEAMVKGGTLTLRGRAAPPFVELTIADTGQGIAAEHLAKIFEPFFSTKDGGTGLGLALTQQIVVEHGGTIEVSSEVGRGTTFTVRLPALPPRTDAAPDTVADADPYKGDLAPHRARE